jgi:hypothetical protein
MGTSTTLEIIDDRLRDQNDGDTNESNNQKFILELGLIITFFVTIERNSTLICYVAKYKSYIKILSRAQSHLDENTNDTWGSTSIISVILPRNGPLEEDQDDHVTKISG